MMHEVVRKNLTMMTIIIEVWKLSLNNFNRFSDKNCLTILIDILLWGISQSSEVKGYLRNMFRICKEHNIVGCISHPKGVCCFACLISDHINKTDKLLFFLKYCQKYFATEFYKLSSTSEINIPDYLTPQNLRLIKMKVDAYGIIYGFYGPTKVIISLCYLAEYCRNITVKPSSAVFNYIKQNDGKKRHFRLFIYY